MHLKGKKFIILTILITTSIVLVNSIFSNKENAVEINGEEAIKLIESKLDKESYLVASPCVFIMTGEDESYFKIDYHEKHNDECPGDEETSPLLAIFRVNKISGVIERYNIVEDSYSALE
jgi:hypothetical protein